MPVSGSDVDLVGLSHGAPKLFYAFSKTLAEIGQAPVKNQHDNDQDDQQFPKAETEHTSSSPSDIRPLQERFATAGLLPPRLIEYYMRVASLDCNLLRFLAVSLALHLSIFLYWLDFPRRGAADAPIRVALLPPQETPPEPPQERARPSPPPKSAKVSRLPKEAPTRISRTPAIIAKKDSPILDEKPPGPKEKPAPKEAKNEAPASAGQFQENPMLAERLLPSLKQLLPSLGQPSKDTDRPIPLNTTDPKYRTYLKDVQQIIDANWKYPDLALQYGLQGTVVVEFVILENGRVEGLKLIRSSGFRLLDQEVVRAITASSPFGQLPPWFESKQLWVSATMEYHDGRFKAWLAR